MVREAKECSYQAAAAATPHSPLLLLLPRGSIDLENKNLNHIIPTISELKTEARSLFSFAFPTILAALILYACSAISMLFLGHIGKLELAGGSLAILPSPTSLDTQFLQALH
ncbi:hypothetical protein Bca52824_023034 [Brassica carinata]|uniref:Uncharacterized protein n=1 Tax=Brassica carinata TaxID=52824 RepID=A0A8X7VHT6_BRACI|nr:hypothetical protein Bca52824_023034 [Brassica carinata]